MHSLETIIAMNKKVADRQTKAADQVKASPATPNSKPAVPKQ